LQKEAKKQLIADRRKRRQRVFNMGVLAATLVIIVVVTAYALNRPQPVVLPSYLDKCIPLRGPYAYSEAFKIIIVINGGNQSIPAGIGINGTCVRPLYTLVAGSGGVHLATDMNRTYTLDDFFLVWGSTFGRPWNVFDQEHLFSYTADSTHHITMIVNNQTSTDYQNYVLPRNSDPVLNPYEIRITYG